MESILKEMFAFLSLILVVVVAFLAAGKGIKYSYHKTDLFYGDAEQAIQTWSFAEIMKSEWLAGSVGAPLATVIWAFSIATVVAACVAAAVQIAAIGRNKRSCGSLIASAFVCFFAVMYMILVIVYKVQIIDGEYLGSGGLDEDAKISLAQPIFAMVLSLAMLVSSVISFVFSKKKKEPIGVMR